MSSHSTKIQSSAMLMPSTRVHEYNAECLLFTYLPYHNTPQFLALLSILPPTTPTALRFLLPYIQSPTNPPRRTIVYTAINTPAFFKAYQSYIGQVITAGHQASLMLSFWSGITVESIFGILNNSSSGRKEIQDQTTEGLVLEVLPVLNTCMRAKYGAETVAACYAIVIMLVNQAKVGDNILDGLMEAVVLAHDEESVNECLACLAIIAGERSAAQIPAKVFKRLLRIPQLSQSLMTISKQCRIGRLVLGCALGALSNNTRLDDKDSLFLDLMGSRLLTESHLRIVLSALLLLLRDSAPGSEEHAQLLALATKLIESQHLMRMLQDVAKDNNADLGQLGLIFDQPLIAARTEGADSEDEDMVDADEDPTLGSAFTIQLPAITTASFLNHQSTETFINVADAFAHAVSARKLERFLSAGALHRQDALKKTLYFSFLARMWSGTRPVPVRLAALRAAISAVKQLDNAVALQHLLPYVVGALTDPAPTVRRSAATLVGTMSGKSAANSKSATWGSSDLYGKANKKLEELSEDDFNTLVSSMLVPILEESVMDPHFIIPALKDLLEGSQTSNNHPKHAIKAQSRASILSFFASHASLTSMLSLQLLLLPMFGFSGKVSDPVRSNSVLPLIRQWCGTAAAEVSDACATEGVANEDAERGFMGVLLPKEAKSAQLLQEIVSGSFNKERDVLASVAFDRIKYLWPLFRSESRLSLAQCLLHVSFKESTESFDKLCRERALETLRSVKLDSTILVTFLESMPSAVQMPEGPPAKKRRRTSRNEMARVELSSQEDLERLLRHFTLVLELIEGSEPGKHPALFRPLFNIFGELQPLKQQSGSELVYLQSMILGSLSPIVNTLKVRLPEHTCRSCANLLQAESDTAEYQSAVRADLLIDCIRHSTSPQVQNSALLLIANLASWVPDLILHNLMPIFTFIGSTLLRQQDDYSAQVVDKVCCCGPPLCIFAD
jgi:U3 small nucleolar RNA-associated protein 10